MNKALSREDILAMEPGRELDALVAQKVMEYRARYIAAVGGEVTVWVYGDGRSRDEFSFKPSTDISAAWEAAEKFDSWEVTKMIVGIRDYKASVNDNPSAVAYGDTVAEALAKAALLALIEGGE